MIQRLRFIGFSAIVAILVASCASSSPAPVLDGVPNWVLTPPKQQGSDAVFVANGTSESADVSTATARAVQDLKDKVLLSIGFKDISNPPTALKAAIDSWSKEWDSVAQTAPAGVQIVDRFTAKKASAVTVFIKVTVSKDLLDRQKARFTALNVVVDSTRSVQSERDADQKLASGDVLASLQLYVSAAAVSASQSNFDAVDRSLDKAMEVLKKISLKPLGSGYSTSVGVPFSQSLEVLVLYGNVPLPSAPLRLATKIKKDGRIVVVGQSAKTNERGIATFALPVPTQPTKDDAIVVFDVNSYLEALVSLPRELRKRIESIEDWAAISRVSIPYTVVSQSEFNPIAVGASGLAAETTASFGNEVL